MRYLSNNNTYMDETTCAPLCQHPSCWSSNRRMQKGFPRMTQSQADSDSEEEGLPTMKVYNMLDDYGSDSRDKYPSLLKNIQSTSLPSLSHLRAAQGRLGTDAPYTTPATLSQASKSAFRSVTQESIELPEKRVLPPQVLKQIEVHEFFDLDDLQKSWKDTFASSKYYVWVPSPYKKKKPIDRSLTVEQMSRAPAPLRACDVTEIMVPLEIETERKSQRRHPFLRSHRRMLWSPTLVNSGTSLNIQATQEGDETYVNLLDLPRDVLRAVLDQLAYVDELTTENVQQALLKVVPSLSRDQTILSMASGTILSQHKVKLHDSQFKNVRQPELFQTKSQYILDDKPRAMNPPSSPALRKYGNIVGDSLATSLKAEESANTTARDHTFRSQYKKPLPSIGAFGSQEIADTSTSSQKKAHLPYISLGLPELPSGVKYTKPFTYRKDEHIDFTLEPQPTPVPTPTCVGTSRSDDYGSTLYVTIPSVSTERLDPDDIYQKQEIEKQLEYVPLVPTSTPAQSPTPLDKQPDLTPSTECEEDLPEPVSLENVKNMNENKGSQLTEKGQITQKCGPLRAAHLTDEKDIVRRGTPESTPEPWPQINEEDFLPTPGQSARTTRSIIVITPLVDRNLADTPANTDDSLRENYDDNSERQTIDTTEASPSPNKIPQQRAVLEEGTYFSPAPPPPSPEIKDKVLNVHDLEPIGGNSMTPVMEENEDTPRTVGTISDTTQTGNTPREQLPTNEMFISDIRDLAAKEMSGILHNIGSVAVNGLIDQINTNQDSQIDSEEIEVHGGYDEVFKRELSEEYEKLSKEIDND
ncbi:uncharacterized protein LOC141908785 isoform X2 [Tubulanus polymorphus]|uniref:uncharacterized protein LOC141908785 isoform X2 n=1 Tax=Tubulanus polymorphus TaxID=672921 RepID=UPI003DA5A4D2